MCGETEVDLEPLIAKYSLFLAKDGIGELGVKSGKGLQRFIACLDYGYIKGFVCVRRPCTKSAMICYDEDTYNLQASWSSILES